MTQQQPQLQPEPQLEQRQFDTQQTAGRQIGGQEMAGQQISGQGTTGQQTGGQGTTGQQLGGQGMGAQMPGRLSPQQRSAVTNVAQAIEVCEWCADQCTQEADPGMIECIRLCEDVAELGETVLALAPRNSRFTQPIVQAFQQALQACSGECGRHHHAHCQECSQVLSQVSKSVQQLTQPPSRQQL